MPTPLATGYVEGEYVLIAPLASAQVLELPVGRGDRVAAGQVVAQMESQDARIALAQAEAGLAQAENQLANLQEGRRPEEISVLEATLASAQAQAEEAAKEVARQESLRARNVSSQTQLDQARTATRNEHIDDATKLHELAGCLAVGRLDHRDGFARETLGLKRIGRSAQ